MPFRNGRNVPSGHGMACFSLGRSRTKSRVCGGYLDSVCSGLSLLSLVRNGNGLALTGGAITVTGWTAEAEVGCEVGEGEEEGAVGWNAHQASAQTGTSSRTA